MEKYGPVVAKSLNKEKCKKSMYAARSKMIPACPEAMDELIHLMEYEDVYPEQYKQMYWGSVFWDYNPKSKFGRKARHYAILLGDEKMFVDVSLEATFYFLDGTFRCTPHQARVLSIRGSQVRNVEIKWYLSLFYMW